MDDEIRDFFIALEELLAGLEENHERFRSIQVRAAEIQERYRRTGHLRASVEDRELHPIVPLISDMLEVLNTCGAAFRRAEAKALYADGMTMEQVARMFGITRQRASQLIRSRGMQNSVQSTQEAMQDSVAA